MSLMLWKANKKSQKLSPLYKMAENIQSVSSPIINHWQFKAPDERGIQITIFLISQENLCCWYPLEASQEML